MDTAVCKNCGEKKPCNMYGLCDPCYRKGQVRVKYDIVMGICEECGEYKPRHAHGMCRQCYTRQYEADNHGHTATWLHRIGRRQPMSENKSCTMYLGVYIAEQVLSKVFNDVERMKNSNKGFDIICNHGKLIDIKSACTSKRENKSDYWTFAIKYNKIADYFLCIAFDDRDSLNPLHLWLIPGEDVNNKTAISISESRLSNWDKYKLDIDKVISCCNTMKAKHL